MDNTAPIYVEIENSVELRRNLLEDATDILKLLRDLEENFKKISEREELIKHFKTKITSINLSTNKFERILPKLEEKKVVKKEKVVKREVVKKENQPKSELDSLKDEIFDIEKKINAL